MARGRGSKGSDQKRERGGDARLRHVSRGPPVFLVTPLLGASAVARRPASARVAFISRCRPSRVVASRTDDE